MSDQVYRQNDLQRDDAVTVRFAEKFTQSPQFSAVFNEGMALVEETAGYLDGSGRAESRVLSRMASLSYATESMRLTTRLMQLASWLLLHRAVRDGELTTDEARAEKHKVKLHEVFGKPQESPAYGELPKVLRELIDRSLKLYNRVEAIDRMLYSKAASSVVQENAVQNQVSRLHAAFGKLGVD